MNLIKIPHSGGIRLVAAEQIVRVQSSSSYSKIFFSASQPIIVAKVLHWFEDNLPGEMFARVHRSHLVNKMFMYEIHGCNYSKLLLTNGETVPMSRRKRNILKRG